MTSPTLIIQKSGNKWIWTVVREDGSEFRRSKQEFDSAGMAILDARYDGAWALLDAEGEV